MKKIMNVLLMIAGAFLFFSCTGTIEVSLNVSEIVQAADNDEVVYTSVTIVANDLSESEDINFLSKNLTGFKNGHFITENGEQHYSFDIAVPIVHEQWKNSFDDRGDLLKVVCNTIGNEYYVSIEYNDAVFNTINDYFFENYWTPISRKDFSLSIKLINEANQRVVVTAEECYINGTKEPFEMSYYLEQERYSVLVPTDDLYSSIIDGDLPYFICFEGEYTYNESYSDDDDDDYTYDYYDDYDDDVYSLYDDDDDDSSYDYWDNIDWWDMVLN